MKTILMVSPIPSHPQLQGNSARIFRLGRMFQKAGYQVHFLYFGMEGINSKQRLDMERCWQRFYYLQPQGEAALPSLTEFFHIDDWYDDKVTELVELLCRKWSYDICLVNYVWFSKALEGVPNNVFKVLDTHDVFGDRHLVAREAGIEPAWFYTSREYEARALDRADLVIAIQTKEKEYFETISKTKVEVIGYVMPNHFLTYNEKALKRKLSVGYIGSGNPFNQKSMEVMLNACEEKNEIFNLFEFHIAGTVCKSLEVKDMPIKKWGLVESLPGFYRNMDVIINPMVGGTGLKIKSLEAMAYGKPLVATYDAMVGIDTDEEFQKFATPKALIESLEKLADKAMLKRLRDKSREVFLRYNNSTKETFKGIFC